jgi:hypothetical protein
VRRLILLQLIICVHFFISCGFMEELSLLTGTGGSWSFNQQYRMSIVIDNSGNPSALNDFQVKISIDNTQTDFWNNIENDGRSILFTDSDESTALDFWIERFYFGGQSAFIWAEVPSIPAAGVKTIYMYFCDVTASSNSSGQNTFIFFDNFEDNDVSDWTTYQSGNVTAANDPGAPTGITSNYSLEKISYSDPHGGWKAIGTTLNTGAQGYILSGRIFRPSGYGGGAADRLAIEDNSFNGYGFVTNHSNNLSIERRDGGTGTTIGAQTSDDPPEDSWYKFSFLLMPGGTFDLYYYDIDDTSLWSLINRSDATYSSFDRITVHGGYEYYVDDLRIHGYANPEPSVSFGAVEQKP